MSERQPDSPRQLCTGIVGAKHLCAMGDIGGKGLDWQGLCGSWQASGQGVWSPGVSQLLSFSNAAHWTRRRRGGTESLRVSTPHELKSCPSTSPTHPGCRDEHFGPGAQWFAESSMTGSCTWKPREARPAPQGTPQQRSVLLGGRPSRHVRIARRSSPERRNLTPACLHAP